MRKKFRLKKDQDFQLVFKKGKSFANRQFIIYKNEKEKQAFFRIGLSVSKKIGNAVTRNRIKRYIRQTFHELNDQIAKNYDYVVIARKPAAEMSFKEVKNSLIHVLKIARVLNQNKEGSK
ncbi:ribonuclease P protein component [Bacillus kwashiorkori]|uniref:ribonuclease P protein component n=1 Tax=Bacillus kwashiorkori TaxID=1522318 RepID=UPI000782ED9A|nr:ribonuclease P protein component [Bacillus kwashiorkori]